MQKDARRMQDAEDFKEAPSWLNRIGTWPFIG